MNRPTLSTKPLCDVCADTGWYGDNGPGIKGNSEYQPCDHCIKGAEAAAKTVANGERLRAALDQERKARLAAEKKLHALRDRSMWICEKCEKPRNGDPCVHCELDRERKRRLAAEAKLGRAQVWAVRVFGPLYDPNWCDIEGERDENGEDLFDILYDVRPPLAVVKGVEKRWSRTFGHYLDVYLDKAVEPNRLGEKLTVVVLREGGKS